MGLIPSRWVWVLACLALVALPRSVQAQHARFVLFGDPTEAASQVPENHRFVHPVTDPYDAEDSFVTTDVRAWFLQHKFPKSGILNGGDAQVYAAQIRLALTKQFNSSPTKTATSNWTPG